MDVRFRSFRPPAFQVLFGFTVQAFRALGLEAVASSGLQCKRKVLRVFLQGFRAYGDIVEARKLEH